MGPIGDSGHLQALRRIGDRGADDFIASLVGDASPVRAAIILDTLAGTLRSLDDTSEVGKWVQQVEVPPSWSQSSLVDQGQQVFTDWSLDIVTSLFCASLPFAYAAAQGVEVLERISQLAQPDLVARRIAETGQMIFDISQPGALAPGGHGYQVVRTVRLLHAVIRARLTLPAPVGQTGPSAVTWDTGVLGVPVNQEDLLGTLLSFTTVVFRALDSMGVPLTPESQEAYLQLWAETGALLGVQSSDLVLRPSTAETLTFQIADDLHGRSDAGIHLMGVLMDEMELSMPWGLRKLPRTLVRHLAGDQVADLLGVAPSAWWAGLLPVLATLNRRTSRSPWGRAVLQAPSRLVGRSMIRMWIDRTILGEGPSPVHVGAAVLAPLRLGTSPLRSTVGLRGQLRGLRRALRRRLRGPSGVPVAAPGPVLHGSDQIPMG